MSDLAANLETYVAALMAKGYDPRSSLRPGLSRAALDSLSSSLPFELPDPVRELYLWHDGCDPSEFSPEKLLLFRDMVYLPFEEALRVQRSELPDMTAGYEEAGLEPPVPLESAFPVAGFEGSYYVVLCGSHPYGDFGRHPVASVGEDDSLYFRSVSSMVETCVAWAEVAEFELVSTNQNRELSIWKQHNPGVFEFDF